MPTRYEELREKARLAKEAKEKEDRERAEHAEKEEKRKEEELKRVAAEAEAEGALRSKLEEAGSSSVEQVAEKVWRADREYKAASAVEAAIALWSEGRGSVGAVFRAELDEWLVEAQSWGGEPPMRFKPGDLTDPEYFSEANVLAQLEEEDLAKQAEEAETDKRVGAMLERGETEVVEREPTVPKDGPRVTAAGKKRSHASMNEEQEDDGSDVESSSEDEEDPTPIRGGPRARKTLGRKAVPYVDVPRSSQRVAGAAKAAIPLGKEPEVSV